MSWHRLISILFVALAFSTSLPAFPSKHDCVKTALEQIRFVDYHRGFAHGQGTLTHEFLKNSRLKKETGAYLHVFIDRPFTKKLNDEILQNPELVDAIYNLFTKKLVEAINQNPVLKETADEILRGANNKTVAIRIHAKNKNRVKQIQKEMEVLLQKVNQDVATEIESKKFLKTKLTGSTLERDPFFLNLWAFSEHSLEEAELFTRFRRSELGHARENSFHPPSEAKIKEFFSNLRTLGQEIRQHTGSLPELVQHPFLLTPKLIDILRHIPTQEKLLAWYKSRYPSKPQDPLDAYIAFVRESIWLEFPHLKHKGQLSDELIRHLRDYYGQFRQLTLGYLAAPSPPFRYELGGQGGVLSIDLAGFGAKQVTLTMEKIAPHLDQLVKNPEGALEKVGEWSRRSEQEVTAAMNAIADSLETAVKNYLSGLPNYELLPDFKITRFGDDIRIPFQRELTSAELDGLLQAIQAQNQAVPFRAAYQPPHYFKRAVVIPAADRAELGNTALSLEKEIVKQFKKIFAEDKTLQNNYKKRPTVPLYLIDRPAKGEKRHLEVRLLDPKLKREPYKRLMRLLEKAIQEAIRAENKNHPEHEWILDGIFDSERRSRFEIQQRTWSTTNYFWGSPLGASLESEAFS